MIAAICAAVRQVLLLLVLEALLFSFLNLCDKCGHADADNPDGDHVSSRDHAVTGRAPQRTRPAELRRELDRPSSTEN